MGDMQWQLQLPSQPLSHRDPHWRHVWRMIFSVESSAHPQLNLMGVTFGVLANIDSLDNYTVQFPQYFHHFADLSSVVPSNHFYIISSNNCPTPKGLLQGLIGIFFGEMVSPFCFVEAMNEIIQQSKQHILIYQSTELKSNFTTIQIINTPSLINLAIFPSYTLSQMTFGVTQQQNNNFNQSVIMQHNQSTTIVQSIITFLVVQLDRAIDEQSLLLNLPDFAAKQFLQILSQMSNTAVLQSPAERMFKEDILGQIPKLEKDTLMPKDLSQEKGRPPSPRKNSPRSSASSMRKIAFKKRQQSSIVQRLQSVTMKEKKASKQSKKSQKPPLFPLSQQQPVAEQEIVQGLRDKTQTRLQYYQQQNKLKEQRQHIFQSKLNELNSIIQEDPKTNITYDYGGDALKSNISQHQNVKVVMTRTGISFASKRLKDGLTNMMPQPSKIQVRPRNAKSYKDQIPSSSIKPLQLPLFQMKLVQENNIKNLKLQQYKKFYGKKYNRLDSRNNTIDMNQTAKTTYKQDVFVQKKHMRDNDNQQQNPSKGVIKTKSSTNRKLALPKLNGKYKVLDRYQQ